MVNTLPMNPGVGRRYPRVHPDVERLLQERRLRAKRDQLQTELAAYSWIVRRLARNRRQALAAVTADLDALGDLQPSRQAVAHLAIDRAWRDDRARLAPDTNPYRADAARGLSARARQVAVAAHTAFPLNVTTPYGELPGVSELITPERVISWVQGMVADLYAIASSDEMDELVPGTAYMHPGLVVIHTRSRLGAVFAPDSSRPGIGVIYSKQGANESWEHYVGLGIGAKVYRRGASLYPNLRWASSHASPMAQGLRRNLHAENPWRWEYSGCTWCEKGLPTGWQDACREDFTGHGVTA
ncbi:MAG TPA: hypothetical protein H9987_00545 [Candidatus Luteococcus avicola]|nr:hypothetical protein [Candidatus Luteococcus avicola]